MQFSVQYFPFLVVLVPFITIGSTLYFSSNGKDNDGLPYISDTAINSPENCIFEQGLNIFWVLASFVLYVKYRQVNDILNRHDMKKKKSLNKTSLRIGLVAAFGSSIMANIQQRNSIYVHWIGRVLTFGFFAVYQCMQTVLYLKLRNIIGQRNMTILRIVLSVISVSSFTTFFICGMLAYAQKNYFDVKSNNGVHVPKNWGEWKPDGGLMLHNISAVFEWISVISTMVYLLLFYWEFNKITLYEPDVFVEEKIKTSENMQRTNEAFEDA